MSNSVQHHRRQPTRLRCPWDSPGKNTGVGCHFLLQCMKVKSEREVAQSCLILATPRTVGYQAPPSMEFSRQEYWRGVPLPSLWKHFIQLLERKIRNTSLFLAPMSTLPCIHRPTLLNLSEFCGDKWTFFSLTVDMISILSTSILSILSTYSPCVL